MKLPPRFELGVEDSKSTVLTNYTIGAGFHAILALPRTHHEEVLHTCPKIVNGGFRTHARISVIELESISVLIDN